MDAPQAFMNQARRHLRTTTRDRHDRVDAAFGRFDLTTRAGYAGFLIAHARLLPSAETLVAGLWRGFRPRAPALLADLADLGLEPPRQTAWPVLADAQRWGALYVLEGSRLGGMVLAQRVGSGMPRRYLESAHAPGAWAEFQDALEAAALNAGRLEEVAEGAHRMFDAFEAAARAAPPQEAAEDPQALANGEPRSVPRGS